MSQCRLVCLTVLLWAFGTLSAQTVSFIARKDFGVGTGPRAVAVGDFNGDGKPDLAVANQTSNNVSILIGNGNGTFQPPVTLNLGVSPISLAVADFNADGKLDIVLLTQGQTRWQSRLATETARFKRP